VTAVRKVFRHEDNAGYWDRRWREASEDRDFGDLTIYPIRYAELVVGPPGPRILEIGCGLGRVLKHYFKRGHAIVGIERSKVAVDRIAGDGSGIDVREASAEAMPFADGEFDIVLAFGVYHNIEHGMEAAIAELARVLRPGGAFCVSMRPDNLEMRLNEQVWRFKNRAQRHTPSRFHKWLTHPAAFGRILGQHGLEVEGAHYARNMSILYRLPFLRDRGIARASETDRRSVGYRLNAAGRAIDHVLRLVAPYQMCNVLVFIGRKRLAS
jgi:SAM-dependent methyltransferase